MQNEPGIQKEAAGFIAFMFLLVGLNMAWINSGAAVASISTSASASGRLVETGVVVKSATPVRLAAKKKITPRAAPRKVVPADNRSLEEFFLARGCDYPPSSVTFIAVKDENRLEVWATGRDGVPVYIMEYPICAASGYYGPKLRRGDRQVPEGVYSIVGLNPNSKYHLSMRINYPNEFDRMMAEVDGRTDLGGDIYIHGDCRSIGCIAMGDSVIEELYVLVRDTGTSNTRIIIAPWDLRKKNGGFVLTPGMPDWTPRLYNNIESAMSGYRTRGVKRATVPAATGPATPA